MKVLVVGSGAREHALVKALLSDPAVTRVVAAPGNPGIAAETKVAALESVTDPAAVVAIAKKHQVDLVVVGPEAPLVAGVADAVRAAGILCLGPSAAAARIEGSKAFAKDVMAAAGVPTAESVVASDLDDVAGALDQFGPPYVVKDDGLAAGKGVIVTSSRVQALAHAAQSLNRPGNRIVVEEFLDGPEVSVFCLTDGTTVIPLPAAQDFKRVGEGDEGLNTGGMGAYSPLPWAREDLGEWVVTHIAEPTICELAARGTPFVGVLYVGLAMTSAGPKVVEFNARIGDPDGPASLARVTSPLGQYFLAAAQGRLGEMPPLEVSSDNVVVVVLASQGYPTSPRTGHPLSGVEQAAALPGVTVLHAGTEMSGGTLRSAGGRVLAVLGRGPDLACARDRAYAAMDVLDLQGSHHRRDIARHAADDQLGALRHTARMES